MFGISTTKWETDVKKLSREEWKNLLKSGMEDAVGKWKDKRRNVRETREEEVERDIENEETGESTQSQGLELDMDSDQVGMDVAVDELEESFSEIIMSDIGEDGGGKESEENLMNYPKVTSSLEPSTHSDEGSSQKEEEDKFDVSQIMRFVDQCAATAGLEQGECGGGIDQLCKSTDDAREHDGQEENVMEGNVAIRTKRRRNYSYKHKIIKPTISEEDSSLASAESAETVQLMEEEKRPEGQVENGQEEMRESQINDSTQNEREKVEGLRWRARKNYTYKLKKKLKKQT
jgi:hypothetical protein